MDKSFNGDGNPTRSGRASTATFKGDGNGSKNGPVMAPGQDKGESGNKAHRSAMNQIGHGGPRTKGTPGL